MSNVTESLNYINKNYLRAKEYDVRQIAKEHGAKIRRNKISGIDATFQDGTKKHYYGWELALQDLINCFEKGGENLDDKIKYIIDFELSENVKEALNSAVQAIYFNDNSDYLTALKEVVNHLLEGLVPEYANDTFINELVDHLNPHWNN